MKTSPRYLLLAAFVCVLALCLWLRSVEVNAHPKARAAKPARAGRSGEQSEPASGAVAAASEAGPVAEEKPAGVNAADFYKDAYQLYQGLSEREKYILKHPTEELEASEAEALFAKVQPIMDLLRRARDEGTYADWGIKIGGFDTPIPQITAAFELGRMAQWDAGYLFPTDPAGALGDLAAQSQLARSVGDQALIGSMVATSLDRMAANLISDNLAMLTPELMQQAGQLLANDPRISEFVGGLKAEGTFMQGTIDALLNPATQAQLVDTFASSGMVSREMLEAQLPTLQEQSNWLIQTEREFAQKALLPDAEFNAWWNEIQEEGKSRPFAELTLPMLGNARAAVVSAEVDRTMLMAGMSILQGGPSAVGSVMDPTTGRAFNYVETATGFELRSPFAYKNKPIVMTFAVPGK